MESSVKDWHTFNIDAVEEHVQALVVDLKEKRAELKQKEDVPIVKDVSRPSDCKCECDK